MRDLIRKYKKVFFIFAVAILLFLGTVFYYFIELNFEEALKQNLKKYANLNIEFSSIKIRYIGKVIFSDFVLKDNKGNKLIKAKEVSLYYKLSNLKKIENLLVYKAEVDLRFYNEYECNIVDLFTEENVVNKVEEVPEGKDENDVSDIIKKITIKKSKVLFRDNTMEEEIYKELENTTGSIIFSKGENISITAEAQSGEEKYEFDLKASANTTIIKLNIKNINIDDNIMQYSYKENSFSYKEGKTDLVLTIQDGKVYGKADLKNGIIRYADLNEEIKNINGYVMFDIGEENKEVKIEAEGYVNETAVNFGLGFKDDKLSINIKPKNKIDTNILKLYTPLSKLELPLNGIIDKADVNIEYQNDVKIKIELDSKEIKADKNILKNCRADILYEKNIWKIENLNFDYSDKIKAKIKFKGKIEDNIITGNVMLNNFYMDYLKEKLNLKCFFKFNIEEKKININIENSKFLKASVFYNIKTEDIKLDFDIFNKIALKYNNNNFSAKGIGNLSYSLKENILKEGRLSILTEDFFEKEKISFYSEIKNDMMDIKKLYIYDGEDYIYTDGKYNIKDMSYNFEIRNSQADLKKYFKFLDSSIALYAKGSITGKNRDFKLNILLISEYGEYLFNYKGMRTTAEVISNAGDISIRGKGDLKEVEFRNQKIRDLNFTAHYEDKKIYLDSISNNFLKAKGIYELDKNNYKLVLNLREYKLEKLELLKDTGINGYVGELEVEADGDLKNSNVNIFLKNTDVSYKEIEKINLSGNINVKNSIVTMNNFKVDNNIINGKIDIKEQNMELKCNIIENNYKKYYNDKIFSNLAFRVMGEINIWGKFEEINMVGALNLDNLYIYGGNFFSVFLKFNYTKGNIYNIFKNGILNMHSIAFLNQNRDEILKAKGYYDFEKKYVHFETLKENINLEKFNNPNLKGDLNLELELNGQLDKLSYKIEAKSKEMDIFGINIKNIESDLSGNEKKITLKTFNLKYNDNPMTAYGDFDFETLKYNLRAETDEIDLKLLSLFIKDKVKDIEGKAEMNIIVTNDVKKGFIKIRDMGLKNKNNDVRLEAIDSDITITTDKIEVEKLDGKLNNGTFISKGNFKMKLSDVLSFRKYKPEFTDWDFKIIFQNIEYNLGNALKLTTEGNINVVNKDITGKIKIKNGEINKIPEMNGNTKSAEMPSFIKEIKAELDIQIDKSFKIMISNLAAIINNLETNIEGSGSLRLENGKINLMGTLAAEKGVVTVNNNDFKIESGVLVFDNPYEYLPEFNPSIAIFAETNIAGYVIYANVKGYYKEADVSFTAENLSYEEILSLLAFHNKAVKDATPQGIMKDILDRQLNMQVFNPISKRIEKILGISTVKIYSNLLKKEETGEISFTDDVRLGAELELGNPLYKDILFINMKAKLSDTIPGEVDFYDIWANYRILETSYLYTGIKRNFSAQENEYELRIGFEFFKRYNRLLDLLKNIK